MNFDNGGTCNKYKATRQSYFPHVLAVVTLSETTKNSFNGMFYECLSALRMRRSHILQ